MKRLLIVVLFLINNAQAFVINRVILSSDANPEYIEFWPIVAKAWKELIGVQPTLILIASADCIVDESIGDVIRIEPISHLPTSMQARVVRLFAPALFPDDFCIIADIDMIPLNKDYFINSTQNIDESHFVVYRDATYPNSWQQFPMCYNAAKGSLFAEIFHVTDLKEIKDKLNGLLKWIMQGYDWYSLDELMLYKRLKEWPNFASRCTMLNENNTDPQSITRFDWHYDKELLKKDYYREVHCKRPYSQHKNEINFILSQVGFKIEKK